MNDLNKNIAIGTLWLLSLKFLVRGMGIISTLLLVRLLAPEDFGLNAIAMSIFSFIEIFSRFGFDTVLIQKQNVSRSHYDTAWTFNVLFGFFSFTCVFFSSSVISSFYSNENLNNILLCISFLFLINGFMNIGIVDFRKNFTFDKEFKLHIIPKVIGFLVTISLAFYFKNYWALIVGTLVWKVAICFFSYSLHPYRPRFSLSKTKELFNFSKWIFVGNYIDFINTKSPELLVGKLLSAKAAGLFSIGAEISNFATSELVSNVNRAAYPGYSKVAYNPIELEKLYLNVMKGISFWAIPAGIGLASVSQSLVPVVLGAQWADSAEIIEYLALGSLLFSLNSNTVYIFLAIAKPQISIFVSTVRVLIFIPLIIVLIHLNGYVGAAQAVLISSFITFLYL